MEAAYLVLTLACPILMVLLIGWWAWSMRRPNRGSGAVLRSAVEDGEIARMREQLEELQARERYTGAASGGRDSTRTP